MKKLKNVTVFLLFTYSAGVLIGITFWFLRLIGVLKVKGWQNFPHWRKKVVVISNHPSLVEPVLLVGLFFHQYVFRPFKYGPWTLADKKNYYDKYPLLQPRLIPIDRTRKNGDVKGLSTAKHIIRSGGSTIWFPEGGRTCKGKIFLMSRKGKRIRIPLKEGFVSLVTEPGAILSPIWFEYNRWYDMHLTIGELSVFTSSTPRDEVVTRTEQVLLELADHRD